MIDKDAMLAEHHRWVLEQRGELPVGSPSQSGVPEIEVMAEAVHNAYLETCARLGWPVKESNNVPYAELSEDSKELDRASVRAVLHSGELSLIRRAGSNSGTAIDDAQNIRTAVDLDWPAGEVIVNETKLALLEKLLDGTDGKTFEDAENIRTAQSVLRGWLPTHPAQQNAPLSETTFMRHDNPACGDPTCMTCRGTRAAHPAQSDTEKKQ
jgi:hypothetical protein